MADYGEGEKTRELARYRPYLLNRLIDLEPRVKKENSGRFITAGQLRKDIFDNLEMLFNSRNHPSLREFKNYEEVADSVLGYGISDFCGQVHSANHQEFLRAQVLKQLQDFEPRFVRDSITVEFQNPGGEAAAIQGQSVLRFTISGTVRVQEVEEELRFSAKLDKETGIAELTMA